MSRGCGLLHLVRFIFRLKTDFLCFHQKILSLDIYGYVGVMLYRPFDYVITFKAKAKSFKKTVDVTFEIFGAALTDYYE